MPLQKTKIFYFYSSPPPSSAKAELKQFTSSAKAELKQFTSTITSSSNGLDNQREDLIAMAEAKAAKAERKRKKKEEKARRKAEKRAERKRILEEAAQNGDNDDVDDDDDDDSDIQVVEEDKNGVCTVRIEPKPIKLTIKTNGHHHKRLKTTPSPAAAKAKDFRTKCDQCDQPGDNDNLVRCDHCRQCFHFLCLIPPLKKSPKVPGYGWHCNDCSADSDWNLD